MIAGDALARWLADPASHAASLAYANRTTVAMAHDPRLYALRAALAEAECAGPEERLAIADRFLARHEDVADFIVGMTEAAAGDPFYRPGMSQTTSGISSGLVLFDEAGLMISIGVTSVDGIAAKNVSARGPASINFTGHLSSFHFVKSGEATLSFWEAPRIGVDFSADRAGRCRFVERRRIRDGEILVIDGRRQSFTIDHATSDLVHFHAQVRAGAAPLAVEYDSKTLEFVGASATDEAGSRTQLMISLLRIMDRNDALHLVEESLKSPHFYTRWHVMREYLAMDARAALPSLVRMAERDPHPDVRHAARQTLETFFSNDDYFGEEREEVQCRA